MSIQQLNDEVKSLQTAMSNLSESLEKYGLTYSLDVGTDNTFYPSGGSRNVTAKEVIEIINSSFEFPWAETDFENLPEDVQERLPQKLKEQFDDEKYYDIYDDIFHQIFGDEYFEILKKIPTGERYVSNVMKFLKPKIDALTEEELNREIYYYISRSSGDYSELEGWVSSWVTRG